MSRNSEMLGKMLQAAFKNVTTEHGNIEWICDNEECAIISHVDADEDYDQVVFAYSPKNPRPFIVALVKDGKAISTEELDELLPAVTRFRVHTEEI